MLGNAVCYPEHCHLSAGVRLKLGLTSESGFNRISQTPVASGFRQIG